MKATIDIVLFGYDISENDLKVLLIKRKYNPFKNQLALIGGYIDDSDSIENTIIQVCKREAYIDITQYYLEQLYTFGDVKRDSRERTITVAYYGLVNIIPTYTDELDISWVSINDKKIDSLAFDHSIILKTAIDRLKNKIKYQPIGFDLLPEYFLMNDLYNLYCTILNKSLDKANFSKKILKYDLLELVDKKIDTVGRPKHIYKFKYDKYQELKMNGFYFEIK